MMIDTFNSSMQLTLAALCGWAVMSRRVDDGIVIKLGLICMSLGFAASGVLGLESRGAEPLSYAHALLHIGLLICVVGYLLRSHRPRLLKRATDWMDLA